MKDPHGECTNETFAKSDRFYLVLNPSTPIPHPLPPPELSAEHPDPFPLPNGRGVILPEIASRQGKDLNSDYSAQQTTPPGLLTSLNKIKVFRNVLLGNKSGNNLSTGKHIGL